MQTKLQELLKTVGLFTEKEIRDTFNIFTPKSFSKNEFLIKEGEVCDWFAFVNSGITRSYYVSSKDEEITHCLSFPGSYVSAYSSFITQKKTFENIQALTDVEVLVIHKAEYNKLIELSANWLKYANILSDQTYLEMENRLLLLQMESAESRYQDLLKNNPEYLQHVSLKHLASYLGITQRHLSRLRKNITL